MSNFFRDSNLFATRNNKPLFQSGNGIKIGGNSSGLSTSVVLNPFNHYKKADKYNPFNEGGKLQGHGNGEDESKIALEAHVDEKYEDEQKKENIDERKNEIRDYDRNKGEKENISLDTSTNTIYDGDDEIEITEVRDLSDNNDVEQNQNLELDNKAKENMKEFETDAETTLSEQNQGSNNNNSSNKMDKVSMEYLLNTISHLNEKNSFLQKQILVWKSKNESINNQLNKQADSVITLKQQIHKLKTYLSSFNADLIDLKNKIINFGKKRDNLAVDLSNAKINISQEHEALTSLKSLVTNLKNQQHLNQSTMEQKQLQMDNLKIKVNDLAGRLSEEKIKNNQLNKSLLNSSNKYESDLFKMSEKNQKLIELLLTKRIDFEKDWEVFVRFVN